MKTVANILHGLTRKKTYRTENSENGATVVEYAILVAIISVAAIAIIVVLGGQVQQEFQSALEMIQAGQAQQ